MPENTKAPSPFAFWLEEALTSWVLPVVAVVAVVVVGILYWVQLVSEQTMAALVIVVAPLVVALIMARPALDSTRSPQARAMVWAAAILTLLVSAIPAFRTVFPGQPLFQGSAGIEGEEIPVNGIDGRVRLLVEGKLPEGGQPTVQFTLTGPDPAVEGKIERTFTTARVGRGGRAQVAHDHTSDYYSATLPHGLASLKLDRLSGQLGDRLQVIAYRFWFTPLQLLLATILLLFAVGGVDARVGLQGNLAVTSGMALLFGLLVTVYATPVSAVALALGGAVMGAMGGALAGSIAAGIMRKLVPQARRRAPGKAAGKTAAKPDDAAA